MSLTTWRPNTRNTNIKTDVMLNAKWYMRALIVQYKALPSHCSFLDRNTIIGGASGGGFVFVVVIVLYFYVKRLVVFYLMLPQCA